MVRHIVSAFAWQSSITIVHQDQLYRAVYCCVQSELTLNNIIEAAIRIPKQLDLHIIISLGQLKICILLYDDNKNNLWCVYSKRQHCSFVNDVT